MKKGIYKNQEFVTIDRPSKCREVNSDEPVDRTEDCDHIEQATDDT